MGGYAAVSPGARLLRGSRMFSLPPPLPENAYPELSSNVNAVVTQRSPTHQTITSPLLSREKGDWGLKRPMPLKTTMTTSTPYVHVKQLDSRESVIDFGSATGHTLSRQKFQEMRIAMTQPQPQDRGTRLRAPSKSVFEEDSDLSEAKAGSSGEGRWKFKGPWLTAMNETEFSDYIEAIVRPQRNEFRALLKELLAEEMTASNNRAAQDQGIDPPAKLLPRDITADQFADYLRALRHDRVTLHGIVSKFLDLPPLGQHVGILQTFWSNQKSGSSGSPYGKTGPPPSHPSAGLSYLRTNAVMENHPVYGPQAKRTPTLARIVLPRKGALSPKLGVGGFVADAPPGDNEFNTRRGRHASMPWKTGGLTGITHLDTTTPGGAKAYVEPFAASVASDGRIQLRLNETTSEAQVIAKEAKGKSIIYNDSGSTGGASAVKSGQISRVDRITQEVLGEPTKEKGSEKEIVGSSESYGLGSSPAKV